jgi:dTDP-4-dehydrorhamnose 3,5-epimerase
MNLIDSGLPGVWILDATARVDQPGSFEVLWDGDALRARGLEIRVAQCNLTISRQRGTIRGLHWQVKPFDEVKIVQALRGRIFDVAVDLRPESASFRRWVGVELTRQNRRALYVPSGFAHGYQTLTDDAEVMYVVSAPYSPPHQAGARWNDPAFGIEWPLGTPTLIHWRDTTYPDFRWEEPPARNA